MNTIELTGLKGDNPMAFLAALGLLFTLTKSNAKLGWNQEPTPTPILYTELSREELLKILMEEASNFRQWDLFNFQNLKLEQKELYQFFDAETKEERALRAALLTDLTMDRSENPKPTDLYFCAGNQNFIAMEKKLLTNLKIEHLEEALFGPWLYSAMDADTFMWDTRDDRNYALLASNPATAPKATIPGCDCLAFLGLALLPSFGHPKRILTPGASGSWKDGAWTWILWKGPLSAESVRSLMQIIPRTSSENELAAWIPPKAVTRVYQSRILRSDLGGYGTIRPPRLLWSEDY